jgi:hypothetical protein
MYETCCLTDGFSAVVMAIDLAQTACPLSG